LKTCLALVSWPRRCEEVVVHGVLPGGRYGHVTAMVATTTTTTTTTNGP
jgi:hypothetical protein